MLLHASCVAVENKAVLITGPAGAGKSDLTLRLIDEGAELVADDQTELYILDGHLMAKAPPYIGGLMEMRHVGLIKVPYKPNAPVKLYVELVTTEEKLERLPDNAHFLLLDHPVPHLRLPSFAASTPAKIRAALRYPLVTDAP